MRKLPFGIYKLTMLRSAAFQSCRMFFHGALRAVPKNYALEPCSANCGKVQPWIVVMALPHTGESIDGGETSLVREAARSQHF